MADAMKINPKAKYPDHRGPKELVRNRSRPEANMANPEVNAMAPTFKSVSAWRGMSRKTLREMPMIPPRDRRIVATKLRIAGKKRALDLASGSGVEVVVGSCGKFSPKLDENVKRYAEVYPEIADYASSRGVKLAYEIWPGFNFAYTPDKWKMIFDAVPSRALGLNFDPSHLVWQFVDYLAAARNFAERIYSFHAKDTEIIPSRLSEVGITGDGWWRFRIPGWGSVNWNALISVLIEKKYSGIISVEHEDPLFDYEEGLKRGLSFLKGLA